MLAIAGALLIPACGGGGGGGGAAGVNGDYYVSVNQFASGAVGFKLWLDSTMEVMASGVQGNDSPGSGIIWSAPKSFTKSYDEEDNPIYADIEGWGSEDAVTEQTPYPITGIIRFEGNQRVSVTGMTYAVIGNQYGYLRMTLGDEIASGREAAAAMAAYFGATLISELDSSSGNTGGYSFNDKDHSRVLMTNPRGCRMEIWFNFATGKAMVQLITLMSHAMKIDTSNGQAVVTQWSQATEGPMFSSGYSVFWKHHE